MTKFGVSGLSLAPEAPKFLHQLPSALLWVKVWDKEANGNFKDLMGSTLLGPTFCRTCLLATHQISSSSPQHLRFGPVSIEQGWFLSPLTLDSSSCVPRVSPSTGGLPLEFHKVC